jgi:two-component system NtrC family sensor kinase
MTENNLLAGYNFRSLSRSIVLLVIICSVIPLIIVSGTIYYQFHISYKEKVLAHLHELVYNHAQNIDNFLHEKLADIRFLTDSFGWDDLQDEPSLKEHLEALKKDFGQDFADLGVVNADGKQIAYAGPYDLANANYSDAEWFRRAMQSNYYISDVFLGLRGLPHFIIAVRNSRDDGHWILRTTIDFATFTALVDNIRLGQTGLAFILNNKGELQTTPAMKPVIDITSGKAIYDQLSADPSFSSGNVRMVTNSDISGNENIYIAAFLKNKDWLLVYQQRTADAFADLDKTFAIAMILMLIGLFGIVIMTFTLYQKVFKRVAKADIEKQMMRKKVVETGKLASVGELAAGIAHEINNPVAIMVEEAGWMGDLMEDVTFDESENRVEFERAIEQIQTQGKRCKEITHKLLSFARQTDSTIENVNIKELLEELVAFSYKRAKYSMVEIHTDCPENLSSLKASASELQQVFFNLVNNAIDAMDNQGGRLTISCRKKQQFIIITLSDTGKGIAEANLERIFDPFFTTKPVGKGTGLGLSICYGIIEKMGGKIEVESSVGAGTTFTVTLPLKTEAN